MKRYFIILTAILMVLGCQKEEKEGIQSENILKEFRAEIISLETKSLAFPASGKIVWEKGDRVIVDNGSQRAEFVYNSSRDVFVTESNDFALADSYKAVFPASAYSSASPAGNPQIIIPESQKLYPGYVKDLPMTGSAGKDAVFSFQTACAPVMVDFPADRLPDTHEKELSTVVFSSGDKTITFDCTDVSVENPLYVGIPVGEYQGVDFAFTFADNSSFSLGCSETVSVLSNTVTLTRLLTPWAAFSGGTGTAEDPYIIRSAGDFIELVSRSSDAAFADKCYKQTEDIDLTENWAFAPLGPSKDLSFKGTYDGNGHSLKGINYVNNEDAPSGLFRYTDGAVIKNLKLESFQIKSPAMFLGGFTGYAVNTTFENCAFNGGSLRSDVKKTWNEYSNVTTDANNFAVMGGIAAYAQGCTFDGCSFLGSMSCQGKVAGGIAGYANDSDITDSRFEKGSEVYVKYHCAGGIAGALTGDSNIRDCSSEGYLSCFRWGGGIAGYHQSGTVERCVVGANASVNGREENIGGVSGALQPKDGETAVIDRCTVYSDVMGKFNVGGMTGCIDCNDAGGNAVVANSSYLGERISSTGTNDSGYSVIGGITGWIKGSHKVVIENCMAAAKQINTAAQNKQEISDNTQLTTCKGGTGGLYGFHDNGAENGESFVSNCYTTATLSTFLHRYQPVTTFSGYDYYGAAFGQNARDYEMEAANYYNNEGQMQAQPSFAKGTVEGLTLTEMTDGTTFVEKLNTGKALCTDSGLEMAGWTATEGSYPMLDCVIADPNPIAKRQKRVSVTGDSISSFAGYTPAGYNYHYPCDDGSVTRANQTYWYQLIYDKLSNARLDVNMSYSGAAVTRSTDSSKKGNHWYGNSYVERYIRLGGMGEPDIVLIHGGTNDYYHNDCPLFPGSEKCMTANPPTFDQMDEMFDTADQAQTLEQVKNLDDTSFCTAYIKLVRMIQTQYPGVKVVCIIGDCLSTGIQKSIIYIANHYGARYVDLLAVNGFNDQTYMPKHDYSGSSGCHPDAKAMTFISDKIYKDLGPWLEE